ncbi:LytR C-terminal domain-containing protein [Psychromicrobium lacuslunae]|uniref:LytR C-terminal domain-containing protein n=1 Tax=Psychromicrobium lacuslunae TaxID=1618207 RepID=UPI000697D765|nr:LytR C-terminal domain-containing protein [Psychromicrobium lacuslunae]
MTDREPAPIIPPKPQLSPRKLRRERGKAERQRRAELSRLQRAERNGELHFDAETGTVYHGHRVVAAEDLRAAFDEDPELEPIRRNHRRWHRLSLALVAGLLIVVTVLAILVWRGVIVLPVATPTAAKTEFCPSGSFEYPANISVSVNVFNSTMRTGLAATLASELKKRGYRVLKVADGKVSTSAPGVIVSGSAGQAAAFNLQRNLPGLEYRHDDRTDNTVDVYLAAAFDGATPANKVDRNPGKLICAAASPKAAGN